MNMKLWHVIGLAAFLFSNMGYASDKSDKSDNESNNGKASVWNLAKDVGASSNQISFNQNANGVWFFMQSATLAQTESSYSFLPRYCGGLGSLSSPCVDNGIDGLLCWYSNDPDIDNHWLPVVEFNATATTQFPKTITWPAQTLAMHPAPDKLAIVGWRSPVSGKIDVTGSFSDFDANCGNGVLWFINQGNKTLDSGNLPNGGKQSFNLAKVKINPGEVLYFIVDPKDGDHFCDTTGLDLTITASGN